MRRLAIPGILLGALLLAPSAVLAVPIAISGSNGLNGLGSFTGSFDYTPGGDTSGTIDIVLNNTSASVGWITAFVFNLPEGSTVSAAPLDSSDNDFDDLTPLGDNTFDDNVNGAPYGTFDIGGSTGMGFEGGGPPNLGIASGFSGTFQFALTGTGLGALTAADFLSTLSTGTAGEGNQAFVVRFRGFETGAGSDKVPIDITGEPIPEPGTMILLSLGLATLSARRLNSRKP
jgi:hypothetical protein